MSAVEAVKQCPDCGVQPGNPHADGCDVAVCLHTGQQRLSCFRGHHPHSVAGPGNAGPGYSWCSVIDAIKTDDDKIPPRSVTVARAGDHEHSVCGCTPDRIHDDCGADAWTGEWPGNADAAALGWWSYWQPPRNGERFGEFVRCAPEHPGATPDLNRLTSEGRWDRTAHRWVAR